MRPAVSSIAIALLVVACGRTDRTVLPERGEYFELLAATLPEGEVGLTYDARISVLAVPAASRLDWRLVTGDLPPGLALRSDGVDGARLTGVPEQTGRFAFRLEVSDPLGRTDARNFEIEVAGQDSLRIVTAGLPDGIVDVEYGVTFEAAGGRPPYQWEISSGRPPLGLGLDTDGGLSGVPRGAGIFTFGVRVLDALGARASGTFEVLVDSALTPLRIVTAALPTGAVDEPYEATIEAEGGLIPYRWAWGPLPEGLEAARTPEGALRLSGRPEEVGTFEVPVQVEDDLGGLVARGLELEVVRGGIPLRILTLRLSSGRVGEAYAALVVAEGGQGPYRWRIAEGALPSGLELADQGAPTVDVVGVPRAVGTSPFVIEVTDADGVTASRPLVIDVEPAISDLEIVTRTLPDGLQGSIYGAPILATGGLPPYSWAVVSGTLPPNLALDAAGTPSTNLSGQLVGQGSFNFEVEVSDSSGRTAQQSLTVEVAAAPTPPRIVTQALPGARTCEAYAEALQVTGGLPPMTWSVSAGSLPSGLSLDSAGRPGSSITGYPDAAGQVSLTVMVEDALGQTDTQALTLTVTDAGAPRWAALVGRIDTFQSDVYLSNVCGATPSTAVRASSGNGSLYSNQVAFSPDGRKLAFVGDYSQANVDALYLVDLRGSIARAPVRVHAAGGLGRDVRRFAFSPDSQWLAFAGDLVVDGQMQVAVVDISDPLNPGAPVVVSSPAAPNLSVTTLSDLSWSGDSRWLAYRAAFEQAGRTDVYVTSVSTTTGHTRLNPVVAYNADVFDLAWSPAGNGLAYSGDFDVDSRTDLYFVGVSSTGVFSTATRVSDLPASGDVRGGRLGFAPDGSWLTYTANVVGQADELFGVYLGGAGVGTQTRLHTPLGSTRDVSGVLWSPTEARILYVADQDSENINELYMVDLRTATPQPEVKLNAALGASADVRTGETNLAWSSDGTWVAFFVASFNAAPAEVYVSDISGASPVTRAVGPARTDARLDARGLFFTPRANRLAVVGDLLTVGVTELFYVDLDAPAAAPLRLNPPMVAGGDVKYTSGAVALRSDGTSAFYIADQAAGFVDEAWSVSVLGGTPGPSTRMHLPLNNTRRIERILVP